MNIKTATVLDLVKMVMPRSNRVYVYSPTLRENVMLGSYRDPRTSDEEIMLDKIAEAEWKRKMKK